MTNFQRTSDWLAACGKDQTEENVSVQIGCQLEEICEFMSCLRTAKDGYARLLERSITDLVWFANKLKNRENFVYIPSHLRVEALDALCDIEVTGNGVAYFAGFNKEDADDAVLNSNDAKLIDGKPVILRGGKIGKPDGWTAPDLTDFV